MTEEKRARYSWYVARSCDLKKNEENTRRRDARLLGGR